MKKIIALICAAALCVSMCACASSETSMFVCIETGLTWKVVYHKDTRVMYVISDSGYNSGNFTMLVNPDGTPQIYKGE